MKWIVLLLSLLLVPTAKDPLDALKLNQVQVIGSHNSYKRAIDTALFKLLLANDSTVKQIEYSHIPLTEQLNLGLTNLELDVYADTRGGKYASPNGTKWIKHASPYDPQGKMKAPGFKVLHIQDIDFRTNCLLLRDCLEELKAWSDQHPGHPPVFITMNTKDDTMNRPGFTVPEPVTASILDLLDQELLTYLGKDKLVVPDDVRGKFATLEKAVLAGNWPGYKKARGKFFFVLDETGDKRAAYLKDHPSLQGRIFFTNATPNEPDAAFLVMNDAVSDEERIKQLVQKGYMVRTRADADTYEARHNNYSRFAAACRSGAQIITTDYYRKSTHFPSNYIISFEGNKYRRINPVTGQ